MRQSSWRKASGGAPYPERVLILRRLTSGALLVACLVMLLGLHANQARAETIGGERLAAEGIQVDLGPEAEPLPDIRATTWVIADATTGAILAAKDAHVQRAPASTLKTLTALTVLPNLPLDGTYRPSQKDASVGGTRVGLVPGKPYTVRDLLYGAFLPSGNDAATALARANGGVRETVQQMNDLAAQLQAFDTVAVNPTGLDEPGQVSSAYDLSLFARAGLARPDFAEFARTKTFDFPARGSGTYRIYNTNRLLMSKFRGAIGIKTGYTTNAGRTYIGAAERKGTTIIVSMMGITEPTIDAARKALTWGLRNHDKVTPIGALVDPITTVVASPTPSPSASVQLSALDTVTSEPQLAPGFGARIAAGATAAVRHAVSDTRAPYALGIGAIVGAVMVGSLPLISRVRQRRRTPIVPMVAAQAMAPEHTLKRASTQYAVIHELPLVTKPWRPGQYRRLRRPRQAQRRRRPARAFPAPGT